VEQTLFPHTNHKTKTMQVKKPNKSKAHSVVCNLKAPHPHKEQENKQKLTTLKVKED
jgi:hypothetical protein